MTTFNLTLQSPLTYGLDFPKSRDIDHLLTEIACEYDEEFEEADYGRLDCGLNMHEYFEILNANEFQFYCVLGLAAKFKLVVLDFKVIED